MFLLNSCLGLFTAARSPWHPFSRSYGAILPNSLTMLLPPALGSSPHLPVSVYGTGPVRTIAAFLGRRLRCFATHFRSPSHSSLPRGDLPPRQAPCLDRSFHSRLTITTRVPTVLSYRGTGLFTCFPSATPSGLALGPDLPRADQLYPGNLGYSAEGIPTLLSLLIPAFSLPAPPRCLTACASLAQRCSSTACIATSLRLRCRVSAPDIFGAGPLDQ